MSKEELLSSYQDDSWRQKYLELNYVVAFFGQCVLKKDYKIPDALNAAIVLTEAGRALQHQLTTKHKVNAKEARLMCLLEFEWVDLLVDVEKTSVDKLLEVLEQEMLQRRIFFPNRYGRELYDKALIRAREETPVLIHTDAVDLLKDSTIGVYQLGNILIGPLGVLRSSTKRWLAPSRHVPLYHCADLTCDIVHRAYLSTDDSASIVERREINLLLKDQSERPSDWSQFTQELMKTESHAFDDKSKESLHLLLGDAFAPAELQVLLDSLADAESGGGERATFEIGTPSLADIEDVSTAQAGAERLQALLCFSDDGLARALDRAIQAGSIIIPAGEIRTPVTNRGAGVGHFQLQPRASPLGVRFIPRVGSIAPLRLRRLVDSLYVLSDNSDVSELEWQLRGTDASQLGERVDQFLAQTKPIQVVERLVLGRRTNLLATCKELGIDTDVYRDDREFVQIALWKLGFDAQQDEDVNREFWSLHGEMKRALVSAGGSAVIDEDAVRRIALSYFRVLEGVLIDALQYTTWALTANHLASPTPFIYRPLIDGQRAYGELTEYAQNNSATLKKRLSYVNDRTTLYPLCRGFEVLAKLLAEDVRRASRFVRPEAELPDSEKYSSLTIFPFKHRRMFIDLSRPSQEKILLLLEKTSDQLLAGNVSDVRNKWSHYRRSSTPISELSDCLSNIELAISGLEDAGLCRVLYSYSRSEMDSWDKTIFELKDGRGRSITLERPSRFDWAQMPRLHQAQYLMPAAQVHGPGEILRFGAQVSSAYSEMWSNYPVRRQAGRTRTDLGSTGSSESAGASMGLPDGPN